MQSKSLETHLPVPVMENDSVRRSMAAEAKQTTVNRRILHTAHQTPAESDEQLPIRSSVLPTPIRRIGRLEPVRVIAIGGGLHFFRTYGPHLSQLQNEGHDIELCAIIDTIAARDAVIARAAKLGTPAELVFVDPFTGCMSAKTRIEFHRLVDRHHPNALIAAVNPEARRAWIELGLDCGLNILADKPITSRHGAVWDLEQAKGIWEDWTGLNRRLEDAQSRRRICMMVNTQRGFDPVFDLVCERVEDVRNRRGCPVTSITAAHADGQFRLPHELVSLEYHGFARGNGKMSHSGPHLFHMVNQIWKAGWTSENKPDSIRLVSSLVQPDAQSGHIFQRQYVDMFGPEYETVSEYSDDEIARIGNQMGEVDATLLIELVKGTRTVGKALIDLQHNSVSARSWLRPRDNLYKKMGRLKHEQWVVQSGPFQTIVVETRQAEDEHDVDGPKNSELGGPNHLEVKVFRNADLLGGGKRLEVIHARDLAALNPDRLHGEQVKMSALREFIGFVQGRIELSDLRSDFSSHRIPVALMSAAYESHIRRRAGRTGFVTIKL